MDELNKTAATEPETRPEAAKLQDAPRRRVGSLTLGACLIAAGIFFLCYYFVPGFDWQLVVRIAPAAALVLLGCEVLFFAARPGCWKYDFVSVLVCLGLIAVCMCLSFLPCAHCVLFRAVAAACCVGRDRPGPQTERDEAEQGVHHTGV